VKIWKKNKIKKSEKDAIFEEPYQIDFSFSGIKSAVSSEINQHPLTIFSGLTTLGSVLYMGLFGMGAFPFAISLGGFFLASSSYVFNKFFRKESFEKKYVENLRKILRKNTELAILKLKKELADFNCPEGAQQIDNFKEKYESLVSVLQKKLKPGGLAYSRFLGMAEQVYKNGLDNLQQVVANLDSISPIRPTEIDHKLANLRKREKTDISVKAEIETLENTLRMRSERLSQVDQLLRKNETAMARLDQTAMDISTMKTNEEQATTDMEVAMNELIHLSEQFKNFKAE